MNVVKKKTREKTYDGYDLVIFVLNKESNED